MNQNPQDGRGVGVSEDGDRSDIDESQNGDAAANNDGETIERESETEGTSYSVPFIKLNSSLVY